MRNCRLLNFFLVTVGLGLFGETIQAAEKEKQAEIQYPASLESLAFVLQNEYEKGLPSTPLLLQLAQLYLDMGDDLYVENSERMAAYQRGADFARLALNREPQNADAHFLYAANLGHVAQLQGLVAAVLSINDIFLHVKTAVSLNPRHAGALHMLGMMYDGLPWILGGDAQKALHYLQEAVAVDANYSHARLNLAKLYLKRQEAELARQELEAILAIQSPRARYAWSRDHVPEARELLKGLLP